MAVAFNRRKLKGQRLERDVTRRVRREGHTIYHFNHSEQSSYQGNHPQKGTDLLLQLQWLGIDRTIQCRSWESGFEACYAALGKKDIVCNRMKGRPILVTMTLDAYLLHLYALKRVVDKKADNDDQD